MKIRRPWLLYAAIAVVGILAGALLARMVAQPTIALAGGTWLPEARELEPFALTDTAGQTFDNRSLAGRPHLLFFGFTYCPDLCPTTLATLAEVYKDPALQQLQVLFVTVDPERDTPENLQRYVRAFSPDFIGLRGDISAEAPLLKNLGAIAAKQALPDGNYTMDHSAALYLLDRQGRYAAAFTPPFTPARLRADLQRIAAAGRL